MAKIYQANSPEDLVAFVAKNLRRDNNYRVQVETKKGRGGSAGELTDCVREYVFFIGEEVAAEFREEGIRYDSDSAFNLEVAIDDRESVNYLLGKVEEYSNPRLLGKEMRGTGRFYVKRDLIVPNCTEDPVLNKGMLKQWLRTFYQSNELEQPRGLTQMSFEELRGVFREIKEHYGLSSKDIVPETVW